jgi:hypothetical protein
MRPRAGFGCLIQTDPLPKFVFDTLDHECQAQRNRCIGDVATVGSRGQFFSDVLPSASFATLFRK